MAKKFRVGVVGATGYSGEELLRLLKNHPGVSVTYTAAQTDRKKSIQELYPFLRGSVDLPCEVYAEERAAALCDLIFLALPHGAALSVVPGLRRRGTAVVDLSADYRIKDRQLFAEYYGIEQTDAPGLSEAVYGLPECFRAQIKNKRFVANPGCYPTSILLALQPVIQRGWEWRVPCVMDAKSGVTGAGKKLVESLQFAEMSGNFKAYKVEQHPHEAEITQALSRDGKRRPFDFVPHLLPVDRGILSTLYLMGLPVASEEELRAVYEACYSGEAFVKILAKGETPELKQVRGTNQCHIGLAWRKKTQTAVVMSVIDNLGKGAGGQAVQNMNLMLGFAETEGLL